MTVLSEKSTNWLEDSVLHDKSPKVLTQASNLLILSLSLFVQLKSPHLVLLESVHAFCGKNQNSHKHFWVMMFPQVQLHQSRSQWSCHFLLVTIAVAQSCFEIWQAKAKAKAISFCCGASHSTEAIDSGFIFQALLGRFWTEFLLELLFEECALLFFLPRQVQHDPPASVVPISVALWVFAVVSDHPHWGIFVAIIGGGFTLFIHKTVCVSVVAFIQRSSRVSVAFPEFPRRKKVPESPWAGLPVVGDNNIFLIPKWTMQKQGTSGLEHLKLCQVWICSLANEKGNQKVSFQNWALEMLPNHGMELSQEQTGGGKQSHCSG